MYCFRNGLGVSVSVRSVDNDIVTGSFLCSLNFAVCISERKILHNAELVSTIFSDCSRVDSLVNLFIWAPVYA